MRSPSAYFIHVSNASEALEEGHYKESAQEAAHFIRGRRAAHVHKHNGCRALGTGRILSNWRCRSRKASDLICSAALP